ncbi:protein chibby homolog 1-like [Gadus chalcogrammus]|uniref:protein chibby homolog 1-like n=1 Tax=Gadus chalcogrammus TaxID=1042646 RepID=UPI0024C495BD|nr:protein chibby homolog 1-like [Gadus chalcogrammus]XP_056456028.1 protein chibby homolog 1-like [Gadus chalcogrammus]
MTSRGARYRLGSPFQRLLVNMGMASSAFPSAFNPRPAQDRAPSSLSSRHYLAGCSRDAELGPDSPAPPTLSLGRGLGLSFQEGRWVRGRGEGGGVGEESGAGKEQKRRIQRLKEENRLLKLSVEVLLDMMTMVKLKDCDGEAEGGGRQASERRPAGGKGVWWAPNLPDKRRA